MYGKGIKEILSGEAGRDRIPLGAAQKQAMSTYLQRDKEMRELLKNDKDALSLYEKVTQSMEEAQNTLTEGYFAAGFRLGVKVGEDLHYRKSLF